MNFITKWRMRKLLKEALLLDLAIEQLTAANEYYHNYMIQSYNADSLLSEMHYENYANAELESTVDFIEFLGFSPRLDILQKKSVELLDKLEGFENDSSARYRS